MLCSEHAHSSVDKAARLLELPLVKVPRTRVPDAAGRPRRGALRDEEAAVVVATVGTTSSTSVDPVAEIAPLCVEAGAWLHVDAPTPGRRWSARRTAGPSPASSWPTPRRQPAQVALHADRLLRPLHEPPGRPPRRLQHPPGVPADERRGRDEPDGLRPRARASLPRAQALGRDSLHGRDGLQALIREHMRLARLFASWIEAAPGWEVVAPVPFSVVCFRRDGSDEENAALLERVNATGRPTSPTRFSTAATSSAWRSATSTTEDDVSRAWELLQEA